MSSCILLPVIAVSMLADNLSHKKGVYYIRNILGAIPLVGSAVGVVYGISQIYLASLHGTRTREEAEISLERSAKATMTRARFRPIKLAQAACEIFFIPLPIFWAGRGIYLLATRKSRKEKRLVRLANKAARVQTREEILSATRLDSNIKSLDDLKQAVKGKRIIYISLQDFKIVDGTEFKWAANKQGNEQDEFSIDVLVQAIASGSKQKDESADEEIQIHIEGPKHYQKCTDNLIDEAALADVFVTSLQNAGVSSYKVTTPSGESISPDQIIKSAAKT